MSFFQCVLERGGGGGQDGEWRKMMKRYLILSKEGYHPAGMSACSSEAACDLQIGGCSCGWGGGGGGGGSKKRSRWWACNRV